MRRNILVILTIAATLPSVLRSTNVVSQELFKTNRLGGYAGFAVRDREQKSLPQPINKLDLIKFRYRGECPGVKIETPESILFTTDQTLTAKNRKVIIANVTDINIDSEFTNIYSLPYNWAGDYDVHQGSDVIKFAWEISNREDKLVVFEGRNQFKYQIVEVEKNKSLKSGKVLESGEFSIRVNKKRKYKRRDRVVKHTNVGKNRIYHRVCLFP